MPFPSSTGFAKNISGFECKRLSFNEKAEMLLVPDTAHEESLRQMPDIKETVGHFRMHDHVTEPGVMSMREHSSQEDLPSSWVLKFMRLLHPRSAAMFERS